MENIPTMFERQLNSDVVDTHAVYKMPAESDVVTHRASMQIAPIEGGSDFEQNQTIRFRVRSGDFIDPSSIMFAMQYKQTTVNGAAGADFVRPANGMGCLFSRLTIYSSTGTVIEDINEHALLSSVMQLHSHTSNHERTVHTVSGGYARAVRKEESDNAIEDARVRRPMGAAAGVNGRFVFHLLSGFLNSCPRYLDTNGLKGLVIELTLAPNATVQQGIKHGNDTAAQGATLLGYTVSDPLLLYNELTMSQAYKKEYLSKVARDGYVEVPYQTFVHQAETHTSNTQYLHFSKAVSRLKDAIFVPRLSSNLVANKDSLETYATIQEDGTWNVMIGSKSYPVHPCKGAAQTYRQMLKVFARDKDCYAGNIDLSQFKTGSAILCVDFEQSQGTPFAGVKTNGQPDITLQLNKIFDTNAEGNIRIDAFLTCDRILRVGNGTAEVLM
jgi:hypothetical protein